MIEGCEVCPSWVTEKAHKYQAKAKKLKANTSFKIMYQSIPAVNIPPGIRRSFLSGLPDFSLKTFARGPGFGSGRIFIKIYSVHNFAE